MRRVCAWCEDVMGYTEDDQEGDTHGICPSCLARELRALAAENGGGDHEYELERFCQVAI